MLLHLLTWDWLCTILLSIFTFYLSYVYLKNKRFRDKAPPGPSPWPVIGNLPQLLGRDLHTALTDLGKVYGKLVSLKIAGENVLVINSMDAAMDSFVRQGKIFSGRPKTRKTVEVMLGGGRDIVMNDVLPELKVHRRIVHSFLSSQTTTGRDQLEGIILQETNSFCEKLEFYCQNDQAFDPKFDVARVVANVLCQCILNRRFNAVDEEFHEQLRIVQDIIDNIESFNIVDLIPWLEHFPIPSWKRFLKSLEKKDKWINQVIEEHRETLLEGKDRDLLDILLKLQEEAKENEDQERLRLLSDLNIGHIIHELFGGGIESTMISILWFILYLLHNPEWQDKIYEEIKQNADCGEMLSPFDRSNYPVLEATIKETFRNASVLPVGFPHRTLKDTVLNGYHISADTMVIMNIWAIQHDERHYTDPYKFDPGRFLRESQKGRNSYLPFGIGHRVCLGSSIAKMSIFMFCASLISRYEFSVPDGEKLPDTKPKAGLTNRPNPFRIKLTRRK